MRGILDSARAPACHRSLQRRLLEVQAIEPESRVIKRRSRVRQAGTHEVGVRLSDVLLFDAQSALEKLAPGRAVAYSCCSQIDEDGHELERVARNVTLVHVQGTGAQVSF